MTDAERELLKGLKEEIRDLRSEVSGLSQKLSRGMLFHNCKVSVQNIEVTSLGDLFTFDEQNRLHYVAIDFTIVQGGTSVLGHEFSVNFTGSLEDRVIAGLLAGTPPVYIGLLSHQGTDSHLDPESLYAKGLALGTIKPRERLLEKPDFFKICDDLYGLVECGITFERCSVISTAPNPGMRTPVFIIMDIATITRVRAGGFLGTRLQKMGA